MFLQNTYVPEASLPPAIVACKTYPYPLSMNESNTQETRLARRWFWLLVAVHVSAWTAVPALVYPSAPLDAVEMRYLGHEWQWGYHKHPPLPAWMAEAAAVACGGGFFGVYLVAQLGMAATLWAVWRLGLDLLPAARGHSHLRHAPAPRGRGENRDSTPWAALLGACLVECCYWYTFATAEFNNNIAMFPFWATTVLFLHWALESGKNRWWIAAGMSLGLCMLCKYTGATLAATMLLFMLLHPTARKSLRRPGPWLAGATATLVFLPHWVWAAANGFPTLEYAAARAVAGPPWIGHLWCPLKFAAWQLLLLAPMAWAALPLTGWPWRLRAIVPEERFRRDFLAAMALGPFVLLLAASAATNQRLLDAYGSQLWMFTGVLLLFCVETRPTAPALHRAFVRCGFVGAVFLAAVAVHVAATPYVTHKPLRVHCPSKKLASAVWAQWTRRYSAPLPVVAGDWWLAAQIALHGPDRPVIYGSAEVHRLDMGPRSSPWTSDEELIRRGGVIVWDDVGCRDNPRKTLEPRYPGIEFLEKPLSIPWRTGAKIPPLRVGVAIVPPRGESRKD